MLTPEGLRAEAAQLRRDADALDRTADMLEDPRPVEELAEEEQYRAVGGWTVVPVAEVPEWALQAEEDNR